MGGNKALSESLKKCLQDFKGQSKMPLRVMIYSFRETDFRTLLHYSVNCRLGSTGFSIKKSLRICYQTAHKK